MTNAICRGFNSHECWENILSILTFCVLRLISVNDNAFIKIYPQVSKNEQKFVIFFTLIKAMFVFAKID